MALRFDDIRAVILRYHERLAAYRQALNDLNVYPVPDGDTGTNMSLTMSSVVEGIDGASSMVELANAIAHSSLMGARGNSGVILSQILRGFADTFRAAEEVGVAQLVAALERASSAAYQAVQKPVEGTILTVLREAAEAARFGQDDASADLATLLNAVYLRSVEALERTPEMLPVLKRAGVVDAGGAGLLLLLASFNEVASGSEVDLPERILRAEANLAALGGEGPPDDVSDLRYEVMFLLDIRDDALPAFRDRWAALGDSIVVVGGEGTYNCHIHTDEIGRSIEAAVEVGRPHQIQVTDLHEQAGIHERGQTGLDFEPRPEARSAPVGVVAVAAGQGLVDVFRELGVHGVVTGGQTLNPSTEDLLRVVDGVDAEQVVVLPNNKNIVPVAEQLDALSTKQVVVVPTRSVPQGVAAMFGYSYFEASLTSTAEDMAAAASSVVTGELTQAVREAWIEMGAIHSGDWLGIADGTIVVADSDQEAALRGLLAAILPPFAEVVTVYLGAEARPSTTKALEAWLAELHPELDVKLVPGGQPVYPYLVSIE